MAKVLVPLAQGCEEIEAITIIDLLRRAEIDVTVAALDSQPVRAAHGVTIIADTTLDEALHLEFDMVVLPGGLPGADNLNEDDRVHEILKKMAESGKFIGAICAAPIVLAKAGLLDGKKATSYPGFLDQMDVPNMNYTGAAVEQDAKILTSRGPGTAMDFGLKIIEVLQGKSKRDEIEKALVRA
jgi:protein deglycase